MGCCDRKTTPPSPGGGGAPAGSAVQSCPCCSRLQIKELAFSGHHPVEKDTTGLFAAPEWQAGRADADQAPVAYTRNQKIAFTAKFTVTTQPCKGAESVQIQGTGVFGSVTLEWTGTTTVNPGDIEVSVSLTSNQPLPNAVDLFESSPITWSMNPCNCGSNSAGTTNTVVYVTLGDPTSTNHWTLLDISCRGAKGETAEAGVIAKAFDPLRGLSVTRKRDSHGLFYWDANPPYVCTVSSVLQLLQAADGTGQCGSWADFLLGMYGVHGITSGHKVVLLSAVQPGSIGFLVKHWKFKHPPASSATSFTHRSPAQCDVDNKVPGQRNTNPPPQFINHFIVLADGKFWDPSYGHGPFTTQHDWEQASIDGLFIDTTLGRVTGFDTTLNTGTNLLSFTDLATGKTL